MVGKQTSVPYFWFDVERFTTSNSPVAPVSQKPAPSLKRARILTGKDLKRTYLRLAHQFLEPFDDPQSLALIGMQTRGVYIGQRISSIIEEQFGWKPDFGMLDVTFYRDDFRTKGSMPEVKVSEIPFDIEGRDIILIDDVFYTGRTIRSAMDALMGYGRPRSIRFCCIVDRGHRELPVMADYVGKMIPTHEREEVRVFVEELDGEDAVYVVSEPPNASHQPDKST